MYLVQIIILFCYYKPIDTWDALNHPLRIWAFVPLVTSSPLTKKGDIYAQIVAQHETFLMIP